MEENVWANFYKCVNAADNALDVVVRDNTLNSVLNGVVLSSGVTTPAFGRGVIVNNVIALIRGAASTAISVGAVSGTVQNFGQVIVRKNVISGDIGTTDPTTSFKGISVANAQNAVVENNAINDCDSSPLTYEYCTNFKSFNNQNTDGTLLRAYDTVNARYLMELEDATEDALLGI